MQDWQMMTVEACKEHPKTAELDYDDQGCFPWIMQASGQPFNWLNNLPYSYMEKMETAIDSKETYVNIVLDVMLSALDSDSPDESQIPENPLSPEYVTAHCRLFATRLAKGYSAEVVAEKHLSENTDFTLISAEKAVKMDFEDESVNYMTKSVRKMDEKHGIDLISERGVTFQVKSYEVSTKERDNIQADYLIEVTDSGIERYRCI